MKLARSDYIKQQLDSVTDTKKFWRTINDIVPKRQNNPKLTILKDQSSNSVVNPEETADFINDFFTNIGHRLASKCGNALQRRRTQPRVNLDFSLRPTSEEEVRKLISEISIYKSSAIKHLSARLVKDALNAVLPQFTHLLNMSLRQAKFPDAWKIATVLPIYKGGNSEDVTNYRPISLLPIPGKILEKIIHAQFMTYLEHHKLINNLQHGFRPNHSINGAINALVDDLLHFQNQKDVSLAVFVDFKKAFDTVDHKILLEKLNLYGIDTNTASMMSSYLTNRYQQTVCNGITSSLKPLTCGVPQGSIMGPLFFVLYINDITNVITCSEAILYADDTVLYTHAKTINDAERIIQRDLTELDNWCIHNKLTINVSKTKCMLITTRNATVTIKPTITLHNTKLDGVESYKYLGVNIDKHLTFKPQTNYAIKSVSSKIYLLSKIRYLINTSAAIKIVKAMILPYLDYGDFLYFSTTQELLTKLQRLLNRALRLAICYNSDVYVS